MKEDMKIIRTHGANYPERANKTDAGMDIQLRGYEIVQGKKLSGKTYWFDEYADHKSFVLEPGERVLAKTGIQIELEKCEEGEWVHELQVRPRSGLALKEGITIVNSPGTIDQDYRGDIGVILLNTSKENVTFTEGQKIAQLVMTKVRIAMFWEDVESFDEETDRGAKGFGDSGQ